MNCTYQHIQTPAGAAPVRDPDDRTTPLPRGHQPRLPRAATCSGPASKPDTPQLAGLAAETQSLLEWARMRARELDDMYARVLACATTSPSRRSNSPGVPAD